MKHFFIIALPRCRTAWLANMLTTERSLCFHDLPIGKAVDVKEFFSRHGDREYVGLTRTSPVGVMELKAAFPGNPFVTIVRDVEQSMASLIKAFEALRDAIRVDRPATIKAFSEMLESQLENITKLSGQKFVIEQRFSALDPETIWRHCLPGLPFDHERARIIETMKIVTRATSMKDIIEIMEDPRWVHME